jgi:glycine/D-amino acid oxidase-like deaminating enzyme
MTSAQGIADAVIIGGGFYGSVIAVYLARMRGLRRVILLERENELLSRASYNNQARVHNGYHYPRSFTTAYRSRVNYPRFLGDWLAAIELNFTKFYAIARHSKVTAGQFRRFCNEIGAPLILADTGIKQLFEPRLIEEVYQAEEYVFNATRLAAWARKALGEAGVEVWFSAHAKAISRTSASTTAVTVQLDTSDAVAISCRYVLNCAYSGLNQFGGDFPGTRAEIKQELTEMALLQVPEELKQIGITVMDGPFFSVMPFPARGLHTLSHVRYTPHLSWKDAAGIDPYKRLNDYDRATRVDRMMRDAGRYLPVLRQAKYLDSLFEIKTVLLKNEADDGRPILFEKHPELPGCYSILGGKIDNVYDILDRLASEEFMGGE